MALAIVAPPPPQESSRKSASMSGPAANAGTAADGDVNAATQTAVPSSAGSGSRAGSGRADATHGSARKKCVVDVAETDVDSATTSTSTTRAEPTATSTCAARDSSHGARTGNSTQASKEVEKQHPRQQERTATTQGNNQ